MKVISIVLVILLSITGICKADTVCISEKETVEIITLLDASERDLQVIETCQKLTNDLYKELDKRDKKVQDLTKELITAKDNELKYRNSSSRWRTIAIATSATTIVLVAVAVM